MSRERMRAVIRLSGGVNPQVKRRPGVSGGADIDLGGGTFDELMLDVTDEQAKALRDKLCLAYGLPVDAANTIRAIENPARPMPADKLPQTALDIMAYLTYSWRTAETYIPSVGGPPANVIPGLLHMLVNAGIAETRNLPASKGGAKVWRKAVMKESSLSKEGRRIYGALRAGWNDASNIAAETDTTPAIVRSVMKQLITGGLAISTDAKEITGHGNFQGACYRLRMEDMD